MATVKNLLGLLTGRQSEPGSLELAPWALSSLLAPCLVADAAGRVIAANEAARTIREAFVDGYIPGLNAAIERCVANKASLTDTVMVPGPTGVLHLDIVVLGLNGGLVLVLAKDSTLEINLRSALVDSRQRYKDLVEISSDFAWEIGSDGNFVFVSSRGAFGYPAGQLVGHSPAEFVLERPGIDGLAPFLSPKPVENVEVWMRRGDGRSACLLVSSSPLIDTEGHQQGARGVCRDITREREREAQLAKANNRERLLTYLVRTIRDVVDPGDMLKTAAEATARAVGANACQILRRTGLTPMLAATFGEGGDVGPVLSALSKADLYEGGVNGRPVLAAVTRYRKRANGVIAVWRAAEGGEWSEDERHLIEDVANQIGIAHEQILNHERILTLSRTDALTGLFNRRAFFEELARRFARLARDRRAAALIYVDLDNFKQVNDSFGHKRGDEALMAVRDILINNVRPSDLMARLGGDEFAMWLEGADEPTAVKRCQAIMEASQRLSRFSAGDGKPLTMSMGVAVHEPGQSETLNELLARADEAMYSVKREGKSAFRIAAPVAKAVPP